MALLASTFSGHRSFSRTKDTCVPVRLDRVSVPSLSPSDELQFLSPKLARAWEPLWGVLISWSWSRGHQCGVTLQPRLVRRSSLLWDTRFLWPRQGRFRRQIPPSPPPPAPMPSQKPTWVGHDCQKEHGRQCSCESLLAWASFTRVTGGCVFGCCTEASTSKAKQPLKNGRFPHSQQV